MFNRYWRPCHRLAYRVTQDHQLAEDAVQDAFLTYLRNTEGHDPARSPLGAWLATLTHRRAVDIVRREEVRRRRIDGDIGQLEQHSAASADPVEQAITSIQSSHVRALLASLPLAQREIMFLTYHCGYTSTSVASALGLPVGTVKTRRRAATKSLRSMLAANRP